jgi:hypothetical protein
MDTRILFRRFVKRLEVAKDEVPKYQESSISSGDQNVIVDSDK